MEKEFILYEEALSLKELGFNEPCLAYYNKAMVVFDLLRFDKYAKKLTNKNEFHILSPLYQQAFKWFRDKHQLYNEILLDQTTEPKFCFGISKFIGNPNDLSEREWDWEKIPNDDTWGLYRKYEEAELACLKKLIEIVKAQGFDFYQQSQQDNEQRIKELEEGIKIALEAMSELGNFQDGWEEDVLKLKSLINNTK